MVHVTLIALATDLEPYPRVRQLKPGRGSNLQFTAGGLLGRGSDGW